MESLGITSVASYMFTVEFLCTILCLFLAYKLLAFLNVYLWIPCRIKHLMEKQGVRGPSPQFLLGNLPERTRMREREMQHDMHAISHDIVGRLMPDYVQWSETYGS